ncbi:M20 family metallo-hydrolase [Oceaniglobus indicus]|uniref:M20 family metallo-hydrolase n=1 Tax=Oceaniglobus indicus TaxID=2047749 RepID=UPI000C17FE80|nr:M20 family metallo-hydrolase [Oceaniglobus indicus]
MDDGVCAQERLASIAAASETKEGVTRLPWSAEHRTAFGIIAEWMTDAGLQVAMDAAGTLIGRTPGTGERPALLLGSHQDSVRSGGRYDGIMGVALACLAVRRFRNRFDALPFAIEVLAFADEEGVRFPTALIGPRALAGTLDPAVFAMADRDGVTMGDAMRGFGADPSAAVHLARDPARVIGYIEAHIEQGPVLEREDLPVGIVTGICGISRHMIEVSGETGHAGTVPMAGRRDALIGAARLIGEIGARASRRNGFRATVGQVDVAPNVVNAIPSTVRMTMDTRSVDDAARADFAADIARLASGQAADTGVGIDIAQTYDQKAVTCDPALTDALRAGVTGAGFRAFDLPSGATHDASAMADLCPVAMLFVRCRDGVSHRPDEYAEDRDMGVAVEALAGAIAAMAERG